MLTQKGDGIIAQLVEQRTENPCVAGSIPADTTLKIRLLDENLRAFFIAETAWQLKIGNVITACFITVFNLYLQNNSTYLIILQQLHFIAVFISTIYLLMPVECLRTDTAFALYHQLL